MVIAPTNSKKKSCRMAVSIYITVAYIFNVFIIADLHLRQKGAFHEGKILLFTASRLYNTYGPAFSISPEGIIRQ